GPARGLQDHAEYARTFLLPVAGRVWPRRQNQALGPALERALVPDAAGDGRNLAWLPAGTAAARVARRVGAAAVAGMLLGCLVLLALRRRPRNLFEVGAAMLAANLLSPITWKSHLVGLLLVAYAVFSLPLDAWPRASRRVLLGLSALLLLSGLSGRSVTGDALQAALFGYSAWTALLLVLFTACLVLALAPPERLGGGTDGGTGLGN
ncbi:MAG TPA: hypothetical protein VJ773_08000, partial [Gemmatimonadales bacterium]|nr:hypothetical protein [Gemmatimonadales bacterium]